MSWLLTLSAQDSAFKAAETKNNLKNPRIEQKSWEFDDIRHFFIKSGWNSLELHCQCDSNDARVTYSRFWLPMETRI